MKKSSKVLSSVLACAMLAAVAATAVSAAEQSTTVGYRAGTTDPGGTGSYLVEIPKDVTFTQKGETKDFSVDLLVWDETINDYAQATSTTFLPDKQVNVKVKSDYGFKLKKSNPDADEAAGVYTYKVKATEGAGTYDTNIKGAAKTAVEVGNLSKDRVDITGQVTLTDLPKAAVKGDVYKDTLTYVLTEQPKGGSN